jgi:Outer membrane protein beta-barrel domain
MKKSTLILLVMCFLSPLTYAGTETYSGKELKQVAPLPCPEWYRDREFNVGIWGTYVFTGNEWENDRYIEADHAWGGGLDAKYFFHRYFGVGLEGWAVSARRTFVDGAFDFFDDVNTIHIAHEHRAIGAALLTLTFRYPIPCSRFAPYAFVGGGGIFGGGERTRVVDDGFLAFHFEQSDSKSEWLGQFGGGFEVRLTPHIGWINDFSWNVINGPENNFGMVRSGLNFAF